MAKILLVEDDNNLREIYGERLMAEGYDIVSASDGEEALQTAVTEKPDLIISDVMMPKISGFDMLDILRQTPETKDVKIIMMTALSQAEDKTRADKLGADKYLVKSQVTLEDVARVVHDLLGDDAGAEEPVVTDEPAQTPAEPAPAAQVVAQPVAVAPEPAVVAPEPVASAPAPEPVVPVAAAAVAPDPVAAPAPAVVTAPTPEPVAPPVVPAAEPVVTTAPEPVAVPQPTTPEPAVVAPEPVASAPAPEPVVPVAAAAVAPDPVAAPAPAANPISGGNPITDTTNPMQTVQAQDSQAELNEVAQQIEQFVATAAPDTGHQEPVQEPTQQDIIHAQNAAEDPTVLSAQPAVPVAATIPPVTPLNTSNPEPASSRKKIIQPVSGEGLSTPDIHALYEQEMAKEAAFSPVENPESGAVVTAPVADDGVANPIASATAEEVAPPPLETVDASQITGMYSSEDEAEAAAILQQAAESQAAPVPTETPAITPAQSGTTAPAPDPTTTDPSDPNNIAL